MGLGEIIGGFAIIVVIFLLATFFMAFTSVPFGNVGVVTQWGSPTGAILPAGGHWITPFIQSVVLVNITTQKYEVFSASTSRDLQTVDAVVALNYHADPSKSIDLLTHYGLSYQSSIISPAVQEIVKAVMSNFTAQNLIDNRSVVVSRMQSNLAALLANRDIVVDQVSLVNQTFSANFSAAIENKVVAQQNLQRQETLLNITKVQANQTIAAARGNATAQIVKAQAAANVINTVNGALVSNPAYLKYLALTEWNGKLPYVVGGSGVLPMIALNTTTVTSNTV